MSLTSGALLAPGAGASPAIPASPGLPGDIVSEIGSTVAGPGSPLHVISGGESEPVWVEVPSGSDASGAIESGSLASLSNFRDIAGTSGAPLVTEDGRTVNPGLAYRSNKLTDATDDDLARMVGAGVTDVVDLRNAKERTEDPNRLPVGVGYTVADVVDLSQGVTFDESPVATVGPTLVEQVPGAVTDERQRKDLGQLLGYEVMATNSASQRAFVDTMQVLIDADGAVVFHCSAGKDRTGLVAAFLLRILGVSLDDIAEDFLASNTYLGRDNAVQLEWLEATWTTIDRVHGGFDAFVSGPLGLDDADVAQLRAAYLS